MKRSCFFTVMLMFTAVALIAQKNKDSEPAVIDWSNYDFTKHFTLKNGGGKNIFADNKRIYISNFQIAQTVMANGKQAGTTNLAKMSVSMTPIDMATYQQLVDKLYKQLQDRLVAEGYTLVTDEEVANSEFAKKQHNGKTIFALHVTPVSFEGSRRSGYKGGASIEGEANLAMYPNCTASNERGGFGVWGSWIGGNSHWVGPKGFYETNSSTDIFGGVRGKYVLDVNQDAYLKEVEALGGGLVQGYVDALMKEVKD